MGEGRLDIVKVSVGLFELGYHQVMGDKVDERQIDKDNPKRPLSLGELVLIVLSGHLGVRKRDHRVDDFGRANGLHVFIAATFYFALIVAGLVILVNYIT